MLDELIIRKPDDWHVHLRDGEFLTTTVAHAEQSFGRILAMPNLVPPLTDADKVADYRRRIYQHVSQPDFSCYFSLYLIDGMDPELIYQAKDKPYILACKLYPKGATTHSIFGVSGIDKIDDALKAMEETGLILQIHGEVTDPGVDVFDREKRFVERYLGQIIERYPKLKIILEHVSSHYAAEFIEQAGEQVAASVTVHHLILTRNDLLAGKLKPHYFCLPIVKTEADRQKLIELITKGHPRFFFGSDSAPHLRPQKENMLCAAGIYSHYAALELLAELFERHGALDKLETFTSVSGANFYGLPLNESKIKLKKEVLEVPPYFNVAEQQLIPLKAGESLSWRLQQRRV